MCKLALAEVKRQHVMDMDHGPPAPRAGTQTGVAAYGHGMGVLHGTILCPNNVQMRPWPWSPTTGHPIFFCFVFVFLHSAAVPVICECDALTVARRICLSYFFWWMAGWMEDGENSGIRQLLCFATDTGDGCSFLQLLFCQRVDLEESFAFQEGWKNIIFLPRKEGEKRKRLWGLEMNFIISLK